MKIPISPDKPLTLFVRIKGPVCTREFRALIDTGSDLCVIPVEDARDMGMQNFYNPDCENNPAFIRLSNTCYFEAESLVMEKVMVGDIEAENVDFVALTLPRDGGIDVILGRSFLKNFKLTVDYEKGFMSIER
ncbi:MAG: retropepsin-like domain-containing protein [Dehalococcoidales bacterium]|jgi:predicted aspartyl protease|nr:retropepsin-like domain-containing protein [Dehalococcoidales bacterium]